MTHATYRRPESVLVVVHDARGRVLLLHRRDLRFWQSVTGSCAWSEDDPRQTACRELAEETGLVVAPSRLVDWRTAHRFAIVPPLARRFAPGTRYNTEHLYSLPLDAAPRITLSAEEHDAFAWRARDEAIAASWSWSNRLAIRRVLAG